MTALRKVPLYCPGGYVGTLETDATAGTFTTGPCRRARCEDPDGAHPRHVFDVRTGWMVNTTEQELAPVGVTQEEQEHHGELR